MVPKVPSCAHTPKSAIRLNAALYRPHPPFQSRGWCGAISCSQNGQSPPPTHSLSHTCMAKCFCSEKIRLWQLPASTMTSGQKGVKLRGHETKRTSCSVKLARLSSSTRPSHAMRPGRREAQGDSACIHSKRLPPSTCVPSYLHYCVQTQKQTNDRMDEQTHGGTHGGRDGRRVGDR